MNLNLKAHERETEVCKKIAEAFEEELKSLRIRNDETTLTEQMTAAFRGRIALCKEAVKQLKEDPKPGANPAHTIRES